LPVRYDIGLVSASKSSRLQGSLVNRSDLHGLFVAYCLE
jgi:hypothetical protein